MSETVTDYNGLIDSTEALQKICTKITKAGRVAIDTEFVWERTFYPALGIVQLGIDQKRAWLLDIPALNDKLEPLGRLLADPEIEKIFHDAKQDLTILRIATGYYPKNIFDTRLAAGFVGPSSSLSLVDTYREFTGEIIKKDETRSNWLQRPLSPKQFQYALNDVLFLPRVRDEIIAKAEDLGRRKWLSEEMKLYDDPQLYDDPPVNQVYSKVKGSGRLKRDELAILRELAAWREKEARRRDRPRRHIIPDDALIKLSTNQPDHIDTLKQNCGLSPRAAQRYGQPLLKTIKEGLQVTPADYPASLQKPRNQNLAAHSRKLIDFITDLCNDDSLDPALLANRKDIEKLILNDDPKTCNIPLMRGWRYEYAGEKIVREIKLLTE
ncbi:MAG: HRDC domain-containing protein [Deltaproteobacteria bacterium]|nr:HRDC domain-containing protein [Deltaproteobacteria bacterium]